MKKINFLKINNIVSFVTMLLSFIWFVCSFSILNVTPLKYNVIVYIILGIISLLGILKIIFIKNKIVNIISIVLEIIIIIIAIIITNKINTTNSFFKNIKEAKETSVYYIIVNKDSKYTNIKSLAKKNIGILNNNTKGLNKAIRELKKSISYKKNNYDNVDLLINDLYAKKIDGILINSAIKDMIDEYHTDFDGKTKIVEKITVTEEIEKPKKLSADEPINVLISGIDIAGDIANVSRSDVNIIMSINPKNHEVLLTSIPRDTYVTLHNTTGLKDKLTHSGIYGIEMTKNTIEDFLDIKIDYYIRVNFSTLVEVIDALGGVDVYSDQAFTEYGYYFNQGYNHLDGNQALMYARIRHVFAEGDRKRGEHQKQIIEAIIDKVSSSKTLLTNYDEIVGNLSSFFQTNIPTSLIKKYVKNQLNDMPKWTVKSIAIEGYDSHGQTYSMPDWDLYLVIPYEESITYCSNMINDIKQGKSIKDK